MPTPVILLACANDHQDPARRLRHLGDELNALQAVLRPGERERRWKVELRPFATLENLLGVFNDPEYHDRVAILHYAGHAGSFGLLLESAGGRPALAGARGLAAFLGRQPSLACVVLNGCSTAGQVRGLTDAGVPAVIATASAIRDDVAAQFATHLYGGLAGGATLHRAYGQAVAALDAAHRRPHAVWQPRDPQVGVPSATRAPAARPARDVVIAGAEAEATTGVRPVTATYAAAPVAAERDIVPVGDVMDVEGWPWTLALREGAAAAGDWSLGRAAGDPLWGLPPLPADVRRPPAEEPSPFRHLLPFGREHAALFFGRGRDIRELYEAVTLPGAPPVIVLAGPSGTGKSSLLAAGLLPRLEGTHETRYVRRDVAGGLPGSLRQALGVSDDEEYATRVTAEGWRAWEAALGRPALVVLDQVDEAFAQGPPGEVDALLRDVSKVFGDLSAQPRGRVLLGVRKEWYHDLATRLDAAGLPHRAIPLDRLDRGGVREAVTGPARDPALAAHFRLEVHEPVADEIAASLLADAASPVAPVLQVLLATMWRRAAAKLGMRRTIDAALYREVRAEGLGLDDFLTRVLAAAGEGPHDVVASGLALDVLHGFTTDLGTAGVRTWAELRTAYTHVFPEVERLLRLLLAEHVLVYTEAEGVGYPPRALRLAHDTLGPLVRRRFEQSARPGQRARRTLESRARHWTESPERPPLEETDLALVERGLPAMREISAGERGVLEASRSARQTRLEAEVHAAAAARTAARERERVSRRFRVLGTGVAVLVGVAGASAWWQGKRLERVGGRARGAAILQGAQALAERGDWMRVALLLRADERREPPSQAFVLARRAISAGLPIAVTEGRPGAFASATFSPDGRRIVTGSYDGVVRMWDAATGRALDSLSRRGESAKRVVFSDDGRHLLVAWADGYVVLLDAISYRVLHTLVRDTTPVVLSAAFSRDGERVVTANGLGTAHIWSARTGELLHVLAGHRSLTADAAFSPDGRQVVTASHDSTVRVWDADSGSLIDTLAGSRAVVRSVAFSPDGRQLYAASEDGKVRVWDVTTRRLVDSLVGHRGWVTHVATSRDGERVVTASSDRSVRVWSAATRKVLDSLVGHGDRVSSAEFSRDGRRLVTASSDSTARVWRVSDPAARGGVWPHGAAVLSARYSQVDRRMVTAAWDGMARVREGDTGREVRLLRGHRGPVLDAVFDPNGTRVVTASDDSTVRFWDAASGKMLDSLPQHADGVSTVAVSRDGRRVVTTTFGVTRLWEVATRAELASFGGSFNGEFSPDGQRVITASTPVRIWDARTGRLMDSLSGPGHTDIVYSARFSNDGRWLVTASADRTARVWDVAARATRQKLVGHGASVRDAVFSPDGSRVLTASDDGTARVWDAASGRVIDVLTGHRGAVVTAAFRGDGRQVLTASVDSTARVWNVRWDDLRAALRIEGACLREGDWVELLGEERSKARELVAECRSAGRAPPPR